MTRERRPPSRHAKDCFGSGSLGSHRAESGIFENQNATVAEGNFFVLPGGALN